MRVRFSSAFLAIVCGVTLQTSSLTAIAANAPEGGNAAPTVTQSAPPWDAGWTEAEPVQIPFPCHAESGFAPRSDGSVWAWVVCPDRSIYFRLVDSAGLVTLQGRLPSRGFNFPMRAVRTRTGPDNALYFWLVTVNSDTKRPQRVKVARVQDDGFDANWGTRGWANLAAQGRGIGSPRWPHSTVSVWFDRQERPLISLPGESGNQPGLVYRLTTSGLPDRTFSDDGELQIGGINMPTKGLGDLEDELTSFLFTKNRIYIGGGNWAGDRAVTLVALHLNGRRDRRFSGDGIKYLWAEQIRRNETSTTYPMAAFTQGDSGRIFVRHSIFDRLGIQTLTVSPSGAVESSSGSAGPKGATLDFGSFQGTGGGRMMGQTAPTFAAFYADGEQYLRRWTPGGELSIRAVPTGAGLSVDPWARGWTLASSHDPDGATILYLSRKTLN